MSENILKEYRCYVNQKLLCKASGKWQIEIKNPSNRVINYTGPSRINQDIGLKWTAFQQRAVDLNCKCCKRLQWRAVGIDLVIEIKCEYCKNVNLFDIAEINRIRYAWLSAKALENILSQQII